MKKIFIIVLFLFIGIPALALEDNANDTGGIEDLLKYTDSVENPFAGQKQITDEEFQKTLEQVKAKQKKRGLIKKDKPFKGQNFNDENNGQYLNETAEKNLLLGVSVNLINGDGVEIPMGHYKIVGEKINNKVYLDFYQSSFLVAKVQAIETNHDFDEKGINFVKLLPYSQDRVKVIYGSMDFNAYTFIKLKDKISD